MSCWVWTIVLNVIDFFKVLICFLLFHQFFHIVVLKGGGVCQKKLQEELRELPLNIPVQVQNNVLFRYTEEMKITETTAA